VVRIDTVALPEGLGLQSQALCEYLAAAGVRHRAAELLGVDRVSGAVQLGLGVAGLLVSPMAELVGLLASSVAVGAAGRLWDDSPAGREGAVAGRRELWQRCPCRYR
jgi:hypothetical protein